MDAIVHIDIAIKTGSLLFPQWLDGVIADLALLTNTPVCDINSACLNRYAGAKESVGWHADGESLFKNTRL
jgi:hypothetical protein